MDLYGFYMGARHGVRHHYYEANITSKLTEEIDKEFVSAIDMAENDIMWLAETCLFGEISKPQQPQPNSCSKFTS